MKVTLGNPKPQRLPPSINASSKEKLIQQNSNFSNTFLKHQMFFKPRSEEGDESPQGHHRESEKLVVQKSQSGGMGTSFTSGYSTNKVEKKEMQNLKKMIVNLSHELLVKDSIIATLHEEIISAKGIALSQSNLSSQQNSSNPKKPKYYSKSAAEDESQEHMSGSESSGNFNQEYVSCQPFTLEKVALSESQFVKSPPSGKVCKQELAFHKRTDSHQTDSHTLKLQKRFSEAEESLKIKDKQLQVILNEKKLLSSKIMENQRTIIALESEVKMLRLQSKKSNSKEDFNRSLDFKRMSDYQQRLSRLKKENLTLNSQIEDLKRSKGDEIETSIKEWKKINQTMTDSLVKLNQQNSALTKKLTDLEVRFTTTSTKMSQLQKQNATLKANLQNEKNSYSTLSLHHKHEKDESSRKLNLLQKESQKLKSKCEILKTELQKLQQSLAAKQQSITSLKSDFSKCEKQHQTQLLKLRQAFLKQKIQYEKSHPPADLKQLQVLTSTLKQKEAQLTQQHQSRTLTQKKLNSALKLVEEFKNRELEKNYEVEHYKSKVSELIQKVSQLKIEKINHINREKQKQFNRKMENMQDSNLEECYSSIEVKDSDDAIGEGMLEENAALKQRIDTLSGRLKEMEKYKTEVEKLEDINRRLGDRIRALEQQFLSLKNRNPTESERLSSEGGLLDQSDQSISVDYNVLVAHNRQLACQLQQRQKVIHELRQNLRRQEDNTIGLKLQLDDANKRLATHIQILQACNRKLISSQLKFGNYMSETQQTISQLKQDNEGLQQELKVIYEKLQYFEQRLEENEEIEEQEEQEQVGSNKGKRRKENSQQSCSD